MAVLAGGRSSEHEISLASAQSVVAALDPARYDVLEIAIGRDGRWTLQSGRALDTIAAPSREPSGTVAATVPEGSRAAEPLPEAAPAAGARAATAPLEGRRPAETLPVPAGGGTLEALAAVDVVLPILHGPFGEDGTVQGLLELAGVPYVGAGVAASALAMDKDLFKKVMRDSGIPVAAHHAIRLGDPIENPFGYPVFVKPARLGSSVGITKVHDESELRPAVELAFRHDDKVLVEEFVPGIEVEVGVLGNRVPPPTASLPGQIDTLGHEWYDYASKYEEGGMALHVPPPGLPQETVELLQRRAVESFVACECEGLARVDFFVRERDGEVILNELNTMPGFTATSVW
ncbi:MAG TPA: D-alanine--D-alanine ligase family protein, partial [Acidimicrobiales bacterium]|nr:D-alanine--D-alanine ligase family protein [Acidimicrobiales bacterium]